MKKNLLETLLGNCSRRSATAHCSHSRHRLHHISDQLHLLLYDWHFIKTKHFIIQYCNLFISQFHKFQVGELKAVLHLLRASSIFTLAPRKCCLLCNLFRSYAPRWINFDSGLSISYLLHGRTNSIKINCIGKFRDAILELLYNFSNWPGCLSILFPPKFC